MNFVDSDNDLQKMRSGDMNRFNHAMNNIQLKCIQPTGSDLCSLFQHCTSLVREVNVDEQPSLIICFGGENQEAMWVNHINALSLHDFSIRTLVYDKVQLTVGFPPKVDGHTMIQHERQLIIFGGNNNQLPGGGDRRIFSFDLDTFEWRVLPVMNEEEKETPEGRALHSCVYSPIDQCMYVFGGKSTYYQSRRMFNDLFKFSFKDMRWSQVCADNAPSARSGHSCCFSQSRNSLIIFGGFDTERRYLDDVYEFELNQMKWNRLDTVDAPMGRERHSATLIGDHMLVYGGWCLGGAVDEMYSLDLNTNSWTSVPFVYDGENDGDVDLRRYGHTCTMVNDNEIVVIGGKNPNCCNVPSLLLLSLGQTTEEEKVIEPSTSDNHYRTSFANDITVLVLDKEQLPSDAYRYTILDEEEMIDEELVNKSYGSLEKILTENRASEVSQDSINLDEFVQDIKEQLGENEQQEDVEEGYDEDDEGVEYSPLNEEEIPSPIYDDISPEEDIEETTTSSSSSPDTPNEQETEPPNE